MVRVGRCINEMKCELEAHRERERDWSEKAVSWKPLIAMFELTKIQ